MQLVQASGRQFEKRCEPRRCLELWDGVEVLERTREGVGQAPQGARSEFLGLRIEILVMNSPGQVFRCVEFALHKRPVDDQLRSFVLKARPLPRLDFLPHRFEVPLHAVHSDREDVHEAQVLGVFRKYGRERTWDNVAKRGSVTSVNGASSFPQADCSRERRDAQITIDPSGSAT